MLPTETVPSAGPALAPARRFARLERALFESLVHAAEPAPSRAALKWRSFGAITVLGSAAVPHLVVNRLTVPEDVGSHWPSELERALAVLEAAQRPHNYLVHVDPGTLAQAIEQRLRKRGLVPFRRDWLVLRHDGRPAQEVETPFRIAPATRHEAGAFAEIMAAGFDGPAELLPMFAGLVERTGWHVYVAFDGPRVIAAGALFVRAGAAYLGFAATLRSHRGSGAQKALIARRLQVACALGCDSVLVETGAPVPGEPSPSLDNLRAAGFEPVFTRRNFAPPGTTWSG
jgi:hypothetical protein